MATIRIKKGFSAFILTLLFFLSFFVTTIHLLQPVYLAILLAYILDPLYRHLQAKGLGQHLATSIILSIFIILITLLAVMTLPLIAREFMTLIQQMPKLLSTFQHAIQTTMINHQQITALIPIDGMINDLSVHAGKLASHFIDAFISSFTSFVDLILYLFLVPIFTVMFVHDRDSFTAWFAQWQPRSSSILKSFIADTQVQMSHYLRGKAIELIIVFVLSYIGLHFIAMPYTLLLSVSIALSTLIPVLGTILVSIPLVLVGYAQWGVEGHFYALLIGFGLLMLIDAYLIVPLLFGEKMQLHPCIILIAILFFGKLLGTWGVVLAIPLASFIKLLLDYTRKNIDY